MSRFDYVKYDAAAELKQKEIKASISRLEAEIETHLPTTSRYKSLAMTALEEAYAWIGKAIREDQIERNGSAPLQEQRNNS